MTNHSLTTTLRVVNRDTTNFQFQALLHAYFHTLTLLVKGLDNCPYTQFNRKSIQEGHLVIDQEVDRVYKNVGTVFLDSTQITRSLNLPDVVIWNPWVDKARAMVDFGDDEVWVSLGSIWRWYVWSLGLLMGMWIWLLEGNGKGQ
jgi:glucose-6-phosphate 1-epimerase